MPDHHRPSSRRHERRRALRHPLAALAAFVLTLSALGGFAQPASSTVGHRAGPKPTVVLVHGAFADASGWNQVIGRLQAQGYPTLAPANPLRGVPTDTAYLKSVLATISGPIILVGHSYGGEVITNAATGNPNVKGLVYVAAFAPVEGEASGQLAQMNPGSMLTPENLVFRQYPISDTVQGTDGYINPASFRKVFAADLPRSTAALMAATQRPAELATLMQPSGPPAFATIPSWFVVARNDNAIPAATQRFMAKRANAVKTIELKSSHVAMMSNPRSVTSLIVQAAKYQP